VTAALTRMAEEDTFAPTTAMPAAALGDTYTGEVLQQEKNHGKIKFKQIKEKEQ
jgi:hypothetical protein